MLGQEDVRRLQVPVHDVLLVRRRQPPRDLHRDRQHLRDRERAALDPLLERFPFEQLLDQVRHALERADVVDVEDVGMGERRGRLRLALEPPKALGVLGELRRQHLDRDVAAEAGVARPVHLAHAARADRGDDLIGAEAITGLHRAHPFGLTTSRNGG